MASAWGSSWSNFWGNSWGSIGQQETRKIVSGGKRKPKHYYIIGNKIVEGYVLDLDSLNSNIPVVKLDKDTNTELEALSSTTNIEDLPMELVFTILNYRRRAIVLASLLLML